MSNEWYEKRVQELVNQGMSRSDAQGIADLEEPGETFVNVDVSCPHCGEAYLFAPDRSVVEYTEHCDWCEKPFTVDVFNETTRP